MWRYFPKSAPYTGNLVTDIRYRPQLLSQLVRWISNKHHVAQHLSKIKTDPDPWKFNKGIPKMVGLGKGVWHSLPFIWHIWISILRISGIYFHNEGFEAKIRLQDPLMKRIFLGKKQFLHLKSLKQLFIPFVSGGGFIA